MECLFCKIIAGKIPAFRVYEDEKIIIIDDVNPQTPYHKLVIPKKHIATTNDIEKRDHELMGHMIQSAAQLAKDLNISDAGYRLVMNCNKDGGQSVYHIHLHLMGGRAFNWPPG